MFERLPVLFRSAMYALRGGFLIRPLAIAMILGAAGAVLSSLEESIPEISAWIPSTLFPSHQDPGVAQVILSSIATSIMTVVSIVFAILLMTLTLASTQFSPRILVGFVRDRTTLCTAAQLVAVRAAFDRPAFGIRAMSEHALSQQKRQLCQRRFSFVSAQLTTRALRGALRAEQRVAVLLAPGNDRRETD